MLASSRVNCSGSPNSSSSSPALQLPASQLHHAAIGELLRLLRPGGTPGSNQAYSDAAATAAATAAAAASASNAAASAAAAAAPASAPAQIACEAAATNPDLAPLRLSVEKPWDPPSAVASTAGSKAAAGNGRGAAKGRAGRTRAGGAAAGAGGKKRERSMRERFNDVESFWRSCSPQQRLQLLRVPLAPLLAGVCLYTGGVLHTFCLPACTTAATVPCTPHIDCCFRQQLRKTLCCHQPRHLWLLLMFLR